MKNFVMFMAIAMMVIVASVSVSAQTPLPATSDTISWSTFKSDTTNYGTSFKVATKWANSGKYASQVTFDVKTVNSVIAVTDVPSRSGKKETQLLLTYTDEKDQIYHALVIPDKYKSVDGTEVISITVSRGDSDNTAVKRSPW